MEQKTLNKRLWEAARSGDTKSVEDLVARGANVNYKGLDGCSPLFMASWHGHTETVSRLVDLGADIEAKDNNFGRSPLFVASLLGHTETVSRLVDLGADIEAKDNYGKTPLDYAFGKTKILLQLIQSGVNVSQATEAIKHCSSLEDAHQYIQSLPLAAATVPSNMPPDGGVQQTDQDVILPGIADPVEFKSLLKEGGTYRVSGISLRCQSFMKLSVMSGISLRCRIFQTVISVRYKFEISDISQTVSSVKYKFEMSDLSDSQ